LLDQNNMESSSICYTLNTVYLTLDLPFSFTNTPLQLVLHKTDMSKVDTVNDEV